MSGPLTRHNEHQMPRETPVSRLSTMRETGVSRDIFKGEKGVVLLGPPFVFTKNNVDNFSF